VIILTAFFRVVQRGHELPLRFKGNLVKAGQVGDGEAQFKKVLTP